MPNPLLADRSKERPRIPPGGGYLILAAVFLFLPPIVYQDRPTAHHVRTQAMVTKYVTSSTAHGLVFSPVLTFSDQQGRVQDVTLPSSASQKLLPEGEAVFVSYLDTSSTQLILENDPYQAFTRNVFRVIAIPHALLGFCLLGLYLAKGRTTLLDWSMFGAKIALPWLLGISFLVYAFWPSSGPAVTSFSFHANSGSPATGLQTLAVLFFVGYFLWYVLQWPLMIVRAAFKGYRSYKRNPSEPLPDVAPRDKWL